MRVASLARCALSDHKLWIGSGDAFRARVTFVGYLYDPKLSARK